MNRPVKSLHFISLTLVLAVALMIILSYHIHTKIRMQARVLCTQKQQISSLRSVYWNEYSCSCYAEFHRETLRLPRLKNANAKPTASNQYHLKKNGKRPQSWRTRKINYSVITFKWRRNTVITSDNSHLTIENWCERFIFRFESNSG